MSSERSQKETLASTSVGAWPDLPLAEDFDMDLFLVEAELRELGKWEGVTESTVAAREARVREAGLRSRVVRSATAPMSVLYFAAREATLDRAEALEREYAATKTFADRAPSSRALGLLLGYPPCCVEAWATGPQDDARSLRRLDARLDHPSPALLDFFVRHRAPVGFVPCSLHCGAAIDHAIVVADALEARHGIEREALEAALRGVVLWINGEFFVLFRDIQNLDPSGFTFREIVTTVELPGYPDIAELRDVIDRTKALATGLRSAERIAVRGARLEGLAHDGSIVFVDEALGQNLIAFGP